MTEQEFITKIISDGFEPNMPHITNFNCYVKTTEKGKLLPETWDKDNDTWFHYLTGKDSEEWHESFRDGAEIEPRV